MCSARRPMPDDERVAIERHLRELDRPGEELVDPGREIALSVMDDASVGRPTIVIGVDQAAATGGMAGIGDVSRLEGRP